MKNYYFEKIDTSLGRIKDFSQRGEIDNIVDILQEIEEIYGRLDAYSQRLVDPVNLNKASAEFLYHLACFERNFRSNAKQFKNLMQKSAEAAIRDKKFQKWILKEWFRCFRNDGVTEHTKYIVSALGEHRTDEILKSEYFDMEDREFLRLF